LGVFANNAALLGLAGAAEVAHDDEAGGNAHTDAKRLGSLKPLDCFDDGGGGPHAPLGVLRVRLRISEIHEDAVPHVLGNEAGEASDGRADAMVIGADNLVEVLRIEP
jgi:hypothetical protein